MIPQRIKGLLDEISPKLDKLALDIHGKPELADKEFFACAAHCALFREYGFHVEEGFCDKPTGYRAVYDSGKPGLNAAFLAEYDALPGIGHGCGHNILGAVSAGAGIILKA